MKSVVVTGTSSGIGWGTAKILVQNGFRVFGSVRKAQDAERLSGELGNNFVPLLFDVTDEPAVQAAARQVREQLGGETLFGLVNNAGIAAPAPLIYQSTDDFRRQLEVNLVSVLVVTKVFVPLLGSDRSLHGKPGRIVNISSVGGTFGPPFLGAYAAAKHGLEGFSESLRRELMLYGIDVIVVGPAGAGVHGPRRAKRVPARKGWASRPARLDHVPAARALCRGAARFHESDHSEVAPQTRVGHNHRQESGTPLNLSIQGASR